MNITIDQDLGEIPLELQKDIVNWTILKHYHLCQFDRRHDCWGRVASRPGDLVFAMEGTNIYDSGSLVHVTNEL